MARVCVLLSVLCVLTGLGCQMMPFEMDTPPKNMVAQKTTPQMDPVQYAQFQQLYRKSQATLALFLCMQRAMYEKNRLVNADVKKVLVANIDAVLQKLSHEHRTDYRREQAAVRQWIQTINCTDFSFTVLQYLIRLDMLMAIEKAEGIMKSRTFSDPKVEKLRKKELTDIHNARANLR